MNTTPIDSAPDGANWFTADENFDRQFEPPLRRLSKTQWTPLSVSAKAAVFLAGGKGGRILDIGSGVGKFCLAGAFVAPEAFYYGVERRPVLHSAALDAQVRLGIKNVEFVCADCIDLRFKQFDHFYFHSPFRENLIDEEPIDNEFVLSIERFQYYSRFVFRELLTMPSGTRLCTYDSLENEIPADFRPVSKDFGGLLKFWEKQ
jgi:SAM-dependent methyltransferase